MFRVETYTLDGKLICWFSTSRRKEAYAYMDRSSYDGVKMVMKEIYT